MPPKKDPVAEFERYRSMIPPDVRQDILDTLLEARIRGFTDFVDATTLVMAHVLVGNIPADVAESLKGYFELLFTAVSAHRMDSGSEGGVSAKALERARMASEKGLEARVILDDTPDGLKIRTGVGIPVEGE